MRKKIKDNEVNLYKYYIVNLEDILDPFVYSREFKTKMDAEEVIINQLNFDFEKHSVLKGDQVRKYRLPMRSKYLTPCTKYVYPPHRVSSQKRKTYRTIMRRKLRKILNNQLNTINNQNP